MCSGPASQNKGLCSPDMGQELVLKALSTVNLPGRCLPTPHPHPRLLGAPVSSVPCGLFQGWTPHHPEQQTWLFGPKAPRITEMGFWGSLKGPPHPPCHRSLGACLWFRWAQSRPKQQGAGLQWHGTVVSFTISTSS